MERIRILAIAMVAITVAAAAIAAIGLRGGGSGEDDAIPFTAFEHHSDMNLDFEAYYDDSYFDTPSTELDIPLMVFALNLAMSCGYGTHDPAEKPTAVIDLLGKIGCDRIGTNEYYTKESTMDSTDVAIGAKDVGDCTVLFVAINGAHYGMEFASNMNLGPSGEHQGFAKAAGDSMEYLRSFISENGITGKAKILVTGYSRAAAAANLMSARLSDAVADGEVRGTVGDLEISQGDVYGFCFEPPLCGYMNPDIPPTDARYDNIRYVVNPDDLVAHIPTADWGFVRYGQEYALDPRDGAKAAAALRIIGGIAGEETARAFDMSRFKVVSGSVGNMAELDEGLVNILFGNLTRERYCEDFQEDLGPSVGALLNVRGLAAAMVDELGGFVIAIKDLYVHVEDPDDDFKEFYKPKIDAAAAKAGCPQYADNLLGSYRQMSKLLYEYAGGNMLSLLTDGYILTAVANSGLIIMPHLPLMICGYLMQEDPHYSHLLRSVMEKVADRHGAGRDGFHFNPTMVPSSLRSMRMAAGTLGSPGIRVRVPHSGTMNPAPAEMLISLTWSFHPLGTPFREELSDRDAWVLAMQMGSFPKPSFSYPSILLSTSGS